MTIPYYFGSIMKSDGENEWDVNLKILSLGDETEEMLGSEYARVEQTQEKWWFTVTIVE